MDTIVALFPALSATDRELLKAWLAEFEQTWSPTRLEKAVADLPPAENPLRLPALVGMVRIDLEHQWRGGRSLLVEHYLKTYPEVGSADEAVLELLETEYVVRRQVGSSVSTTQLALRFPRFADRIRSMAARASSGQSLGKPQQEGDANPGHETPPPNALPTRPSPGPEVTTVRDLPNPFGRYQILRRLGKGGMGTVYLAHDTQLDRPVALKVPHFDEDDAEQMSDVMARFHQEARAASGLRHANICSVYDVGEHEGIHYLTMAYIEGQTLTEKAFRHPLPIGEALELVRQLAVALAYAHGQGVIHRDIKPGNVIITPQGEPVIMDFGLARRIDQQSARLTQRGEALGTIAYMPPEQLRGDLTLIGPASDIYSLGVILYELLTGHLPFEGTGTQIAAKLLTQEAPPLSKFGASLADPALEALVHRAIAKLPGDRFESMDEFARCLSDYLHDLPATESGAQDVPEGEVRSVPREAQSVASAPGSRSWRPRARPSPARWLSAFLLVTVVVGLGIGLFMLLPPGEDTAVRSVPTPGEETSKRAAAEATLPAEKPPMPGPPELQPRKTEVVPEPKKAIAESAVKPPIPEPAEPQARKSDPVPEPKKVIAEPAAKPPQVAKIPPVERPPDVPLPAAKALAPGQRDYEAGLSAYLGRGTLVGRRTAFRRFEVAAGEGHVLAQSFVGLMLCEGVGTVKNELLGLMWLEKCRVSLAQMAARGDPIAQANLGKIHAKGHGVPKDEELARDWFRKAAEQDDVRAMNLLGLSYASGQGGSKGIAAYWYQTAAEKGYAPAQANLGRSYQYGHGVARDEVEAIRWFRKAADQGEPTAQLGLGLAYLNGRGVMKNEAEAVRWLRQAAEQDFPEAQIHLGTAYAQGLGVVKDEPEAARWYLKAAEQGYAEAQVKIGRAHLNGRGVENDDVLAARWFLQAAEQGFAAGQLELGKCYLNGRGVVQDPVEALRWFRRAAEQGFAPGELELGRTYLNGRGVEKDYVEALRWFRKAAEQGEERAQTHFGMMLQQGLGVSKDEADAVHWFRKAADAGYWPAQGNLGRAYELGLGVAVDYVEAVRLYRLVAGQGKPQGQYDLGRMYELGRGVEKYRAEALHWYRKAAEQGHEPARAAIRRLEQGDLSPGTGSPEAARSPSALPAPPSYLEER